MTSILDQFEETELQTIPKEPGKTEVPDTVKKQRKSRVKVDKRDDDSSSADTEEKREQLSILSVLGTIETYTGVKMTLGDVKRLTAKDVEKYYNRYQITMGHQVTGGLIETALEAGVEIVSYALPIDNKKELISDLLGNELVKQELSNAAGFVVVKGGRFVALASGLFQIAKHIDFSTFKKEPESELDNYIINTVEQTLE